MKVLVTGGAGFLGSHLIDSLLADGYEVRALDNLDAQVHGASRLRPDYLASEVDLRVGDIRDPDAVKRALEGVEAVFHYAAVIGVGQSMYEMARYTDVNCVGTAVLLEEVAKQRDRVGKLIMASSMSTYGEGAYRDISGANVYPTPRKGAQLESHVWEVLDDRGQPLEAIPTQEAKPRYPASIYAVNKRDQEEMCLAVGEAHDIPTFALRFFNSYGPRQALSNPYTGLIAIFASRIMNGQPPLVFEDGNQMRDFVHVSDVVQANMLALQSDLPGRHVFNVGTGKPITVLQVADALSKLLDFPEPPEIMDCYRVGDIRHCYADISRIGPALGYEPAMTMEEGMSDLLCWLRDQPAVEDHTLEAQAELARHNLKRASRAQWSSNTGDGDAQDDARMTGTSDGS